MAPAAPVCKGRGVGTPDVYRAADLPEAPPLPPRELVYEAVDRDQERGSAVLFFQLFSVPAIVGAVLATVTTPMLGLAGMIGSGGLVLWLRRRTRKRSGAVLRIEEGRLSVLSRDRRRELGTLRLRDVEDVSLEIKKIQRVQEGDSPIPAVRFLDTRVAPEVDTARIVVVGSDGRERIVLTDAYLAHMDATEWLGKIRVFLRKHGWVPEDERDDDADGEE